MTTAVNDRARVTRIEPAGLLGFKCSAYRHERNRQKSVPVPKSIAIKNSSTKGEISHPARIIQARSPRDDQARADGQERDQSEPERPIHRQEYDQKQHDGGDGGPVERCLDVGHIVAADHGVAGPPHLETGGDYEALPRRLALHPADDLLADRCDERSRQRQGNQLHRSIGTHQSLGDLALRLRS